MVEWGDWRQKMVIRVLVEGGVIGIDPTISAAQNAMIQQNSAALREALNRFFSSALNREDVDIRIEVGGGWEMAAYSFVMQSNNDFLYVDLDRPPELRQDWFNQVLHDGQQFPSSKAEYVFFWIQEMEAWFLKQPECIVKWAQHMRISIKDNAIIQNDNLIKGKDIEHLIQKPSDVMDVIFKKYLISDKIGKNGKPRKMTYGKLRHAPGLIQYLEPQRMLLQDKELAAFVSKVMT